MEIITLSLTHNSIKPERISLCGVSQDGCRLLLSDDPYGLDDVICNALASHFENK